MLNCSLIRYHKGCWFILTAGRWSQSKSAKECVTTHLPNGQPRAWMALKRVIDTQPMLQLRCAMLCKLVSVMKCRRARKQCSCFVCSLSLPALATGFPSSSHSRPSSQMGRARFPALPATNLHSPKTATAAKKGGPQNEAQKTGAQGPNIAVYIDGPPRCPFLGHRIEARVLLLVPRPEQDSARPPAAAPRPPL